MAAETENRDQELVFRSIGDIDREQVLRLAHALEAESPVRVVVGETEGEPLPDPVRRALSRVVEFLAEGRAVLVEGFDEVLTSQQAADLLKVSRPFLTRLLDTGQIAPQPSTGSHRRVLLRDVLAYRERQLAEAEGKVKAFA